MRTRPTVWGRMQDRMALAEPRVRSSGVRSSAPVVSVKTLPQYGSIFTGRIKVSRGSVILFAKRHLAGH